MRLPRWLLAGMAAILLAYVAAHSPFLVLIGRAIGRTVSSCYFVCSGWIAYGRPLEAVSAIFALALAGWAAALLGRRFGATTAERLLVAGLLGLGLIVVPASWVGLLGWVLGAASLRPPLGPFLTGGAAAIVVGVVLLRGRRAGSPAAWRRPRMSGLARILAVSASTLLLASAAISLSHPPAGYDALSYHAPLAVYYWRDGDLGSYLDRQPLAWALAHPGTAELWFGLLRVAAGERVASLGQLPLALLGAVAIHVLGRRTGLPSSLAILGGLAFLAAPIVVVQSGMQLNDLAAGSLLLAALALAAAPPKHWTTPRMAMLGLALGLTATTKLAAVPGVAAIVLYLLLRVRRVERPTVLIAAAAGAFALVVAPWWIRNLALYGNPLYPAALPLIGRGYVVGAFAQKDDWFVPHPVLWPLYPVIEPLNEMSGLGALLAVGGLPGIVLAIRRARRGPMVLLALVASVSLLAWWRVTQHEPRLLLGVIGAAFVGLGWVLLAVPRAHRCATAALLAVAALFSTVLTVDQALRPLAVAATSRALYYEQEWGIDSVAAGLPEEDGLLYHTGFAHRSYAGDYPLLGPSQGRRLVVIDGIRSSDSVVSALHQQGLRYAYVPARGEARDSVRRMYPADRFDLVHATDLSRGLWSETRRYLFRLKDAP